MILVRETKRERILENRTKAMKVAEKQKLLLAKRREGEKKNAEDELSKNDCPVARAEKAFFKSLERTKEERESRAKSLEELYKN